MKRLMRALSWHPMLEAAHMAIVHRGDWYPPCRFCEWRRDLDPPCSGCELCEPGGAFDRAAEGVFRLLREMRAEAQR